MASIRRIASMAIEKPAAKKRVAAYCRVSTDKESQEESLENQMASFRDRITQNKDWELVDLYVDEGLTGTSVKSRTRFREMIADCEAGKIDYIMTKGVSRFARNTLDCINYVRRLQKLGVQIYFEKEGITTGETMSEMILTVMASFAQEESWGISENVKWGIRNGYKEGKGIKATSVYGFYHSKNDNFQIVPQEADIVREVFAQYVHGKMSADIVSDMTKRGVTTRAGQHWNQRQIERLLTNEHYVGDVILQKTFTVDHLTHKQIRNRGELPMYRMEGAHAAIVDRHIFDQAQKIWTMRKYGTYPYGEMLKCPHCGQPLVHGCLNDFYMKGARILNGGWGCYGKDGCRNYLIIQDILDEAVLEAWAEKHGERSKRVEYYWLEDEVERIELCEDKVIVHWKEGEEHAVKMYFPKKVHRPSHYAEFYNARLDKVRSGEIRFRSTCLMGL